MRSILRFLPLLALAGAPLAHADEQPCADGVVAAVASWAGIHGDATSLSEDDGPVVAASCKTMPGAADTTIAAIAFDTHRDRPASQDDSKEQVVALVAGGKVVAANRSTIEEDALTQVGSYRIDTAPYRLSPDVRAFGVVFSSSAHGPSCPDASASSELTLWIREGNRLRAVLGTNLDGWTNVEGESCMGQKGSVSESAHMTIAVEKTTSHGFADLSISARVKRTQDDGSDFKKLGTRNVRTMLHYDGTSYGSDTFRDLWYPASLRH